MLYLFCAFPFFLFGCLHMVGAMISTTGYYYYFIILFFFADPVHYALSVSFRRLNLRVISFLAKRRFKYWLSVSQQDFPVT